MLHARLLQYLDEVARCQSMRQAGERLNVAGSAINRQILALEESLGAKIFDRYPHKVVLTAAGELLIEHIRHTLRGMEKTVAHIEDLKGLQWGNVKMGVASGLAGSLLPAIALRVTHSFKRVVMTVSIMSAPDIVVSVASGDIDLGLTFDIPTAGLQVIARKAAALGAVMSVQHPLATRTSLGIEDCAAYPLCVAQAPLTLHDRIDAAFTAASIPLRPAIETDSIELMRCMALDELFITFLSPFDTVRERHAKSLVHVPVPRLSSNPETLILVGRKKGISPLAARVGEMFRTALEQAW